jgi:hypothetical protein
MVVNNCRPTVVGASISLLRLYGGRFGPLLMIVGFSGARTVRQLQHGLHMLLLSRSIAMAGLWS